MESSNIRIKSITAEHAKSSHKLSKIIGQGKKVSQVADASKISPVLYIVTQKHVKIFSTKKNSKIAKQFHACKDYASSYNVDILNSFNP